MTILNNLSTRIISSTKMNDINSQKDLLTLNYINIAKSYKTKKRLGQNFLIDESIIDFIVEETNPEKDETIIEIGSGLGFVSIPLANKCKELIAIELDKDAASYLQDKSIENIRIIQEDILKTDLDKLVNTPVKIVANLPYYITTPILLHLIGEVESINHKNRPLISEMIIMVQKEVGKRITATPNSKNKEWGSLSIFTNYWTKTELIKEVPAKSFWPRPKVESAILKLTPLEKPSITVENPAILRRLVKSIFLFRRKNLKNSLLNSGFTNEVITKALVIGNIPETSRGETLPLEELGKLSDILNTLLIEGV